MPIPWTEYGNRCAAQQLDRKMAQEFSKVYNLETELWKLELFLIRLNRKYRNLCRIKLNLTEELS